MPRPGEVSLAHRGVLLLDELPEFPRSVLEALRQPLEDGVVSVARVGGRALFPARFRLVATMNLCPCGGARRSAARVPVLSPPRIAAYRDKVSRALLDRFDLVVAMPRPRADGARRRPGRVVGGGRGARASLRAERASGERAPRRTQAASELLDRAVDRLPLTGRGRARSRASHERRRARRVGRVLPEHVAEAL